VADSGSLILRPGCECEDIFVRFVRKFRGLLRVCLELIAGKFGEVLGARKLERDMREGAR
jgi:hypothetical protein